MVHAKHQKIRFQDSPDGKTVIELADELKEIKGIGQVNIDLHASSISVEYDLLKVSQYDIEERMVEVGFVLDNGLWQKFKRGWAHFAEENERDNLTAKPHSCCEDPTEKHRGKGLK